MTDLRPDSVAIRAGRADNGTALAPVLWGTSAFVTPSLAAARRMSTVPRAEQFYSRYSNPSVKAFEDAVAALEGAEAALAFASGMGATASVVFALCSPGDHIVAQTQIYSGTQLFLAGVRRPLRHRDHVRRRHPARRLRRRRAARPHRAGDRRDAGQPAAGPHRPGRAGRHRGPVHAGRLHLRHADHPAAAVVRRRPRAPLGHQGHLGPQRRHPRRGGRRARDLRRRHLVLQRAARRLRLALRRHQRPARPPHAAGAHRPPERHRPAPGRVPRGPSRRWPASATRASPRTPSTTWPSAR